MKTDENTARRLHRIPSGWLYLSVVMITGLLLRLLFRLHIHRDSALRHLRGPVVVIGNHLSYLDPFIMAAVMLPRRINFLATASFFRFRLIRKALTAVGAIPKVQFRSDLHALKRMIAAHRAGGVLGIYPEGQRTLDGCMMPIDEAIAKLVHKLDCPVVSVIEHGAYLAWPRWSLSGLRPGRIDVTAKLLFSGGEAGKLDVTQVCERIVSALSYQEYDWQRANHHVYLSTAPARGLHLICHKCPACGRSQAMTSSRFHLTCCYCGNRGRVDRFGLIRPEAGHAASQVWPDAAQWHRWQMDEQRRDMRVADYKLSFWVRLDRPAEDGTIVAAGSGLLELTGSGLKFQMDQAQTGENDQAGNSDETGQTGQTGQLGMTLQFPVLNRTGVNADYGRNCELVYNDQVYRFVFSGSQDVIVLVDAIQAIQAIQAMTDEKER